MACYEYTILNDKYEAVETIVGTSTECLKEHLKAKGWTGLASGSCRDNKISVSAHQKLGYIYGRDRSNPNVKKYGKVMYIRTLKQG